MVVSFVGAAVVVSFVGASVVVVVSGNVKAEEVVSVTSPPDVNSGFGVFQ